MMDRSTKEGERMFKRRAMRYQHHRLPRRSRIPFTQRLAAWLLMILLVTMLLVAIGQAAEANEDVRYQADEWAEPVYRWATVNARKVNFRKAPSLDADVVAQYSTGIGVEVVSVWDGWAEVLHYKHLNSGALYVWAEYLDIVD